MSYNCIPAEARLTGSALEFWRSQQPARIVCQYENDTDNIQIVWIAIRRKVKTRSRKPHQGPDPPLILNALLLAGSKPDYDSVFDGVVILLRRLPSGIRVLRKIAPLRLAPLSIAPLNGVRVVADAVGELSLKR